MGKPDGVAACVCGHTLEESHLTPGTECSVLGCKCGRYTAASPNQGIDQRGIDKDFPTLYEMAQQYDFAERLGGSNAPVLAEADRALRELWMARGESNG